MHFDFLQKPFKYNTSKDSTFAVRVVRKDSWVLDFIGIDIPLAGGLQGQVMVWKLILSSPSSFQMTKKAKLPFESEK